jgi:hypothetical protein
MSTTIQTIRAIRLFRKSGAEWTVVGDYFGFAALYAANPDAAEGLKGNKSYKLEMPRTEPTQPVQIVPTKLESPAEIPESERIYARRQWNHWEVGYVAVSDISGLHWDKVSGGFKATAPRPFIHGYISCAAVRGTIGHSCLHGEGPHRIKVCVVKKDNSSRIFEFLRDSADRDKVAQ